MSKRLRTMKSVPGVEVETEGKPGAGREEELKQVMDQTAFMGELFRELEACRADFRRAAAGLERIPLTYALEEKVPRDVGASLLLEMLALAMEPCLRVSLRLNRLVCLWADEEQASRSPLHQYVAGLQSGCSAISNNLYQAGLLGDGAGARINLVSMLMRTGASAGGAAGSTASAAATEQGVDSYHEAESASAGEGREEGPEGAVAKSGGEGADQAEAV